MAHCFGHKLMDTDHLANGQIIVNLYNLDETVAMVKIAKTDRGALRMSDNWSKKRGDCNCLSH